MKILVLGVGNILLKDEGIGVRVAQELQKIKLPPQVEVIDGGTAGFDLLPFINEADKVIVVDAMQVGGEPGSIYRVPAEEIGVHGPQDISLHGTSLVEILAISSQMGNRPETIVYGVEPEEITWDMELSQVITEKIPRLKELILKEVLK